MSGARKNVFGTCFCCHEHALPFAKFGQTAILQTNIRFNNQKN